MSDDSQHSTEDQDFLFGDTDEESEKQAKLRSQDAILEAIERQGFWWPGEDEA